MEFSIHVDRVEVEVNTKLLGPVCTDLLIEGHLSLEICVCPIIS